MSDADLRARLEDLEGRYAFLDDLVHQLDAIVADQARTLDALRDDLERTRETLRTVHAELPEDGPEPPPPHY
ncbi:MAG TPA: SlyX family protein [Pseudomonadales bacterium]|nr:SlyX family protein [Pseudomonadales bacterium]